MLVSRWTMAGLLGLLLAVAVACGEEEIFETPASSGSDGASATATVLPTSTPEPSPTPFDENVPYVRDAQMYADQMGVTLEEAIDRLSRQGDFGPLNGALEANERETFAGAFLQHQPEFKFVVLFTRDGEDTIRKYVEEGSELDEFVEVRHVQYSLEELGEIRKETDAVLAQLDNFNASSGLGVAENRVHYYVQNAEQVEQLLAEAGLALPEAVVLLGDGPPVDFEPPEDVPGIYIAIQKPTLGGRDYPDAELRGTLVLEGGCLLVATDYGDGYLLPIWHSDHRLQVDGDTIEVVNGDGEVIARVGEPVWMGGAGGRGSIYDKHLHYPVPETCPAQGSWGVGSIGPLDQQPVVPTPVPEGAPPGLHTVQWPVEFAAVEAIVAAMPEQLGDDLFRWDEPETSGRVVVGYGPPDEAGVPKLVVTDLTTGVYFPDFWTVGDLLASQFTGSDGIGRGWADPLAWTSEDTSHSGRIDRYDEVPVHALNWGSSDGRLLFTASAAEYGELEMLVAAVLAAVE